MTPITNYISFEAPAGDTVVMVCERLEDSATNMSTSSGGWLTNNFSYVSQFGAFSPTTALKANANYPRLRSVGAGASVDMSLDILFNNASTMNTWLAAQDLDTMRARLTITEGGVVIAQATSDPYNTNSTGTTAGGSNNPQTRMKIDANEWTTGTYPTNGTTSTNWVGKPEGWTLSSGVLIEYFYPA